MKIFLWFITYSIMNKIYFSVRSHIMLAYARSNV
jgi:hypothetical protein